MKTVLCALTVSVLVSGASAATINYDTLGSTLVCGSAAHCVPNGLQSVIIGTGNETLTLSYLPGFGISTPTPSYMNLGALDLVAADDASLIPFSGVALTIDMESTPPGIPGMLPRGVITGLISESHSIASVTFSTAKTTTNFGTLPGVVLIGSGFSVTYQVRQNSLDLVPPAFEGTSKLGETTIQGAVTASTIPEPRTIILVCAGLSVIGLVRYRNICRSCFRFLFEKWNCS